MNRSFRFIIVPLFLLLSTLAAGQGASIELASTTGGMIINRVTNLQRNAIASPVDGTIVFNLDTGCINYYFMSKWYELCGTIIPTCDMSSDCPSGMICENGICVDDPGAIPCETVEQCPGGFDCTDGFCEPSGG